MLSCFQGLNLCSITPGSWPEFIPVASAQTLQISILRKCGMPAAKLVIKKKKTKKTSYYLYWKSIPCVSPLHYLCSFGYLRYFTGTPSFLSLAFSCVEFPDCWGRDGPERWAVSTERQLWIRPQARFHESGWEKIWPRDAAQTGQLQTHRPHRTGTEWSVLGWVFCFATLWRTSLIHSCMYLRWLVVSSCPKSISRKTLLWILWFEWRFTAFLWTRPSRRPDTSRTTVQKMLWAAFFTAKLITRGHVWIEGTAGHLIFKKALVRARLPTWIDPLQGSTPCGMILSVSRSTPRSWPWCALWWKTMTRRQEMILWASIHSLSAACSKVRLGTPFHSIDRMYIILIICFYLVKHWSLTSS